MTDYHVHIGQFCNAYYSAENVFSALKEAGVKDVWFSSTTSCIYCKESYTARENEDILKSAPTALELYQAVYSEVMDAKSYADSIGLIAHALYWVVPELHFSDNSDITIQNALADNLYEGFKIHPRAQNWSLEDSRTSQLAEEVFSFAQKNEKMILIHCDDDFPPRHFESFISKYPSVKVQLAHCRPKEDSLYMLKKYPNVVCDTAMTCGDVVEYLISAGFRDRLRFGTDFPIMHWRKYKPGGEPSKEELTKEALEIISISSKQIH